MLLPPLCPPLCSASALLQIRLDTLLRLHAIKWLCFAFLEADHHLRAPGHGCVHACWGRRRCLHCRIAAVLAGERGAGAEVAVKSSTNNTITPHPPSPLQGRQSQDGRRLRAAVWHAAALRLCSRLRGAPLGWALPPISR